MKNNPDLIAEVAALIEQRRGEWHQIASDPASGVSYSWLSKFARGLISNPGHVTLTQLRGFLVSRAATRSDVA
jgi:hypothetical protein